MSGATILRAAALALAVMTAAPAALAQPAETPEATPIVIGESFALPSAVMGAPREINVWLPPGYGESDRRYPVLYLLDGGQQQDFHHISGLAQLGWIGGTIRDVIVVGVASVDRRNELAFRAENPEYADTWPSHGQSDRFRRFLAEEAIPFVEGRYRTEGDSAVMGESLAALFIVETFLRQPELFDRYIAVSPSVWWDDGALVEAAHGLLVAHPAGERTLWLSSASDDGTEAQMAVLEAALLVGAPAGLNWSYAPRPAETHLTTFHPAALDAMRRLFAPPAETAQ